VRSGSRLGGLEKPVALSLTDQLVVTIDHAQHGRENVISA